MNNDKGAIIDDVKMYLIDSCKNNNSSKLLEI